MNEETKIKINQLRNEGKKIYEIAKLVNLSTGTISYWLNEDYRKKQIKNAANYFKNLPKERRSEIYKRRLPYIKAYIKNRYRTDPIFKEKWLSKKRKSRHSDLVL